MREKIDNVVRSLLVFLMVILVLDVIWQVFTRYVLQAPSTFTSELSRFLLIWVSLLGAAFVAGKNEHIGIELLATKLSAQNKERLNIIIQSLILCFAIAVMIFGGSMLVYLTLGQPSPSLDIPMGYIYSVLPVSGLLVTYYKVCDLISLLQSPPETAS